MHRKYSEAQQIQNKKAIRTSAESATLVWKDTKVRQCIETSKEEACEV